MRTSARRCIRNLLMKYIRRRNNQSQLKHRENWLSLCFYVSLIFFIFLFCLFSFRLMLRRNRSNVNWIRLQFLLQKSYLSLNFIYCFITKCGCFLSCWFSFSFSFFSSFFFTRKTQERKEKKLQWIRLSKSNITSRYYFLIPSIQYQ